MHENPLAAPQPVAFPLPGSFQGAHHSAGRQRSQVTLGCGGIKLAARSSLLSRDKVPIALIEADSWDQTNIYRNIWILIKQRYYPVKMMNTNLYRKPTRCKVHL